MNLQDLGVQEMNPQELVNVDGGDDYLPYSTGHTDNPISYAGQAIYNAFAWIINGYQYY